MRAPRTAPSRSSRERFWTELARRVDELRSPPLRSSRAPLLDHLAWLRAVLPEKVRPVSDDESMVLFESRLQAAPR